MSALTRERVSVAAAVWFEHVRSHQLGKDPDTCPFCDTREG